MSEQEKREKVIKGLECCINERKNITDCEHCPYREIDEACTSLDDLHSDALALLKAHEPVEPDIEGNVEYDGHGSWWHVCGACRQPIDKGDKFCRWCGRAVKWE